MEKLFSPFLVHSTIDFTKKVLFVSPTTADYYYTVPLYKNMVLNLHMGQL